MIPQQNQFLPHLLFLLPCHGFLSSASKSSLICFTAQGTLARWPCPCSLNGLPPNLNPILLMSDPWIVFTPNPTSTITKEMLSPILVDLVLLCTRPDCSAVVLATAVRMLTQPPDQRMGGGRFGVGSIGNHVRE